jgi:hypothetical protein
MFAAAGLSSGFEDSGRDEIHEVCSRHNLCEEDFSAYKQGNIDDPLEKAAIEWILEKDAKEISEDFGSGMIPLAALPFIKNLSISGFFSGQDWNGICQRLLRCNKLERLDISGLDDLFLEELDTSILIEKIESCSSIKKVRTGNVTEFEKNRTRIKPSFWMKSELEIAGFELGPDCCFNRK